MDVTAELIALMKSQDETNKKLVSMYEKTQEKTVANFGTFTELHGNGSLFGSFPVERDIITAHMRPLGGLHSILPARPSVTENPLFASITGFTATNGAEAVYPCVDAPVGYLKGCNLSAQFGRVMRDTQTIEIDKVMLRANRGDFSDLVLVGDLVGETGFAPPSVTKDNILNVVTKSEMLIASVNLERALYRLVWQGNPANNTAGGGYKEFPGLDRQIATGQRDWHTGTLCPALDSDVKSFAYQLVGGVARDIVEYLSMLEYYLTTNADGMGLGPVTWVIVMRPQLWFELSAVWPCRYLTNRCSNTAAANPVVINDNVNVAMRDAMRAGKYIDINGNRYQVVTDTGIFEHNNINNANCLPGEYASSIYMVPMTIVGGFQATYMEYVDYSQIGADVALLRGREEFWSEGGRYMWAIENLNFCFKLKVKTEPRVILRTPQLAGRIDAVKYSPLQHVREVDPSNAYFLDGGVSLRPDTSGYHVW